MLSPRGSNHAATVMLGWARASRLGQQRCGAGPYRAAARAAWPQTQPPARRTRCRRQGAARGRRSGAHLRSALVYSWMAGPGWSCARHTLARLSATSGRRSQPSAAAAASCTCVRVIG